MNQKWNKKLRSYYKSALEHVIESGHSVQEFSEFALEKFGDRALPHLRNFYQDIQHGRVKVKGLGKSARQKIFGVHASPREREELIRLAAFVRAEKRGFIGGSPEEDWYAAEREVDSKLEEEIGLLAKGRETLVSAEEILEKEYDHIKHVVKNWLEKGSEVKVRKKKTPVARKKKAGKKSVSSKVSRVASGEAGASKKKAKKKVAKKSGAKKKVKKKIEK